MKILTLILLMIALTSCAKKSGSTKGSFKLIMGNTIGIPMNGGAYVETENLSTHVKTIIKMNADNSALIPNGTYNLMFVTFTGPTLHFGTQYCGLVSNAALLTAEASISVSINQATCSQQIFIELTDKIIGTNNKWDAGKFDTSKWGP